jgi:hypothetical protein
MVSMYTVDTRVSWNKDAMIYNNAEGDEFGDGCRPEPREPTCRIDACDAALPCAFLIHGPGSNGDGGVTATCSSVFFNPIR